MTLDELNHLGSKAEATKMEKGRTATAARLLAEKRNAEEGRTMEDIVVLFARQWHYGAEKIACEELFAVLNEFRADILRIAEMRLEAKARTLGQEERMLRAQVSGFLSTPTAPTKTPRPDPSDDGADDFGD